MTITRVEARFNEVDPGVVTADGHSAGGFMCKGHGGL